MRPALDLLEHDVRALVRARRLDPSRDESGLHALVEDAVADYEDRSLRGPGLSPLGDRTEMVRSIMDAVAGLGPLQRYLDDPEIEEIWINAPNQVFVARGGVAELTTTLLDQEQVIELVERMLRPSGRRVDLSNPFVDATLRDGSRLHVAIPDVTREHWYVNIRKFVVKASHLDDLVALGSMTAPAARFLEASVRAGLNILVAGGTQSGKTTLLNCLGAAIPATERVVTAEEVFELQLPLRDVASLQCRQPSLEGTGEIPLRRLVKEALRMRPSRIIVGEVRQAESLDLLVALNSGLPGMASIHANSAREAITKLCTLPLLAGPNVSPAFVVPTVASSIDVVVHCALERDGRRRVREIIAVPGRVEGDVVETSEIFLSNGGRLVRGDGYPPHRDRFERVGMHLEQLLAGHP